MIHDPVKEFDGNAQFVKSARICVKKSGSGFWQNCGLTVISSSLVACWAYKVSVKASYFSRTISVHMILHITAEKLWLRVNKVGLSFVLRNYILH